MKAVNINVTALGGKPPERRIKFSSGISKRRLRGRDVTGKGAVRGCARGLDLKCWWYKKAHYLSLDDVLQEDLKKFFFLRIILIRSRKIPIAHITD